MSTNTITLGEQYENPTMLDDNNVAELDVINAVAMWVVLVVVYAVAVAYAVYCRQTGGYPQISFGWRGFSVSCNR